MVLNFVNLSTIFRPKLKSCGHMLCDRGDIILFFITYSLVNTYLEDCVNSCVEAFHGESPPCHVWWQLVKCKWRYEVEIMER